MKKLDVYGQQAMHMNMTEPAMTGTQSKIQKAAVLLNQFSPLSQGKPIFAAATE